MLFSTPKITPDLKKRLDELDGLRHALGREIDRPGRWMGTLRRLVRATSVEHSTSIEGFHLSPEDALAVVNHEKLGNSAESENELAVACYARAMDHVAVMAQDPEFCWNSRVLLDLHFDTCYFQEKKNPGLWRTGPIGVTGSDGTIIYQAPRADDVPGLMAEVVEWLQRSDLDAHVVVRAAMAHLHLVSVHPFRDGNGRVARIVQSLVLAREGLITPEFGSIEEYLGEFTESYYTALQKVQGARYQPDRDATDWIAFCVNAHLIQARQRLAQIEEAGKRWASLEKLVSERGWPERFVIALEQSLIGGTDRTSYAREAEISPATANADFRRLQDAGLIKQQGKGPNIRYFASDKLRH